MAQLTDIKARNMKPGDPPMMDGSIPGLRFEPGAAKGQGKWILRFVSPVSGKRRDMGLGRYPEVSIGSARLKGLAARKLIADGKDPITERSEEKVSQQAITRAITFEQAAQIVHDDNKVGWKNPKHVDQWINTLRDYVFPKVGAKKVAALTPADFADVLRPIWLEKPETASRVKQRCHMVLKWCWAHGLVQGNPIDVVGHLLPRQPGKRERVQHQPAMPWRLIPGFVKTSLRAGPSNVTRALLKFVILTAARSGEARAMRWEEVNLESKEWTVPAERMKAKSEHRVALSDAAVRVLEAQRSAHPESPIVFPAPRGGVLTDMALTKFLRDQKAASDVTGRVATAHGFRSSFRDWASENGYPRDLAEKALAHTIANKVEAAYHRTDLLDQRRPMMEAWAAHICGEGAASNVVPIRAGN
jgi:integrase